MTCSCEKCIYCTKGKQHPNPNAFDMFYCERKQRPILQHSGNMFHIRGQWIFPCGQGQPLFKERKT